MFYMFLIQKAFIKSSQNNIGKYLRSNNYKINLCLILNQLINIYLRDHDKASKEYCTNCFFLCSPILNFKKKE